MRASSKGFVILSSWHEHPPSLSQHSRLQKVEEKRGGSQPDASCSAFLASFHCKSLFIWYLGNFVQWHLHIHLQCLWKFTLDVGFVPYESSHCNRWSTGFSFSINVRIQSNRGLGSPSWTSWRRNRKCGLRFRHYGMVTHRNTSPQLEKNNHRLKISNLGTFSNQNQPLTFKRR